jgi:acetyl esterase/lipase
MPPLTEVEIAQRIDPELVVGISGSLTPNLPEGELTVDAVRALDAHLVTVPAETGTPEIVLREDGTALELRRYEPRTIDQLFSRSVILWIHGGGMFLGSARQDDALCQDLSEALGVRTVSVDYRLAPEHPYPEPLDDCYTALVELSKRYETIVVVGASAGGGLAAGLALLARDRGGPRIAGLHLYYPMLDDRETASARLLSNAPVWNRRLNRLGWVSYLGPLADSSAGASYAAPARAEDLSNLPPTYLDTGELDMFVEEDTEFAERLGAEGGSLEFVVVPGAVHGFDLIAPAAGISTASVERRRRSLLGMLRSAASEAGADL